MQSRPIIQAKKPLEAVGQLGGHVKRGIATPRGKRTGAAMALVSALPLESGSDKLVLAFLDRSDPVETFDYKPLSGDNAVLIVPRDSVHLSVIKGVCPGDWRGVKVEFGPAIEEPLDLDVDPTGLDVAASDAWVDLVDELGVDCSKFGGYPLWANAPIDVERSFGQPLRFHHRLSSDVVDFGLGGGAGVIYVFVDEAGESGCMCWQEAGGGGEKTFGHYD